MPRWLNLANLLTLLRVGLVPLVIRAIVAGRHREALVLFLVAAITDGVDGPLARRFGSTTVGGAYLDPIADKLLISGAYVALAWAGTLPWWFVGLVFARDLLILAGAGVALCFTNLRRFPPSVWGKASTFVQAVTTVAWMTRNAVPSALLDSLATGLLWPATAITIWSGMDYARRGRRALTSVARGSSLKVSGF